MQQSKIPILIVGANGNLGKLLTKHCLSHPNIQVNILIRNRDISKSQVEQVESQGGRVIIADLLKPDTLRDCCKNIHTVVSCVMGTDQIIINGQLSLIDEAIRCGVTRFIPSDYSYDYTKVPEGIHILTDQRKRIRRELENRKEIKSIHFMLGIYMETYIFTMNYMGGKVLYWGDNPNQKIDMMTYDDTARFLTEALADPERTGDLRITADQLSSREIADIYSRVVGKSCECERLGSFDDIMNRIQNAKKKVTNMQDQPMITKAEDFLQNETIFDTFLLPYQLFMFKGTSKLDSLNNNEFPQIKPMRFEEFLRSNNQFRLNGYK
jgi:nucleoside-diphosphate-sugar epimerase